MARPLARVRALSPFVWRRDHNEFLRLFRTWFPVGHFYSPYPDLDEVQRRADTMFDPEVEIAGVDLRESEQVELLADLSGFMAAIAFPAQPNQTHRYHLDNPAYGWTDGTVLHAMLRHIRPQRVIEVGSGYSSAMLLDTADGWLDQGDRKVQIRFIEPHPQLLHDLMRPGDEERTVIDARPVQDVPLDTFESLRAGDLLFIDSTHVAKAGSDVNHLFFQVLPRLASGVWIHIHDIFMPFEYPHSWILEGRAWQEAYLLRAFLMYNDAYQIRWFQSFMWSRHPDLVTESIPGAANNLGGNIWLQKV